MNKKGFTLIELLVVMGLLMVLMGTTVFGIEKISETTKLRNLKRIKLQIENATSVYFSENVIYEQQLLNKEEDVICTRLYILVQKGLIDKNLSNPINNERIPANLCVYSKLNSNGVVEHRFDYIDEFINKYNNSNRIILEIVNGVSNENTKLLDNSISETYISVTPNEGYSLNNSNLSCENGSTIEITSTGVRISNINGSDNCKIELLTNNTYLSLVNAMLRDNPIISERTDFSVTNTSNTTGSIYKTNKSEDGSYVYYYSGNTTNNWVLFGGFYWRIIRTNIDGSVRLLYSGTSTDTTSGYINSSTAFNSTYNESRYVGYMYGGNTSLTDNRANTSSSTIKGVIDTWYQNNLLESYDKYISKTAIYCNDRSIGSGTWTNSGLSDFYYGTYTRLITNKLPNYKCGTNTSNGLFESTQATGDKFSASTTGGGNGQLTYPVALMTADEVSFAGGVHNISLLSPYAWYYLNSAGGSITGSEYWWILSSGNWNSYGNSRVFLVCGSDGPGRLDDGDVDLTYAVRPVISLSSCAKVTGTGTVADPYVINESISCN